MIKYAAIAILLAAIAAAGLQTYRMQELRTSVAEQQRDEAKDYATRLEQISQAEHDSAARMAAIAEGTQNDIAEIKTRTDAIPAAIRDGNLRLRSYWTSQSSVPATGASTSQPDEGARLRAEGAKRIVRIPAECDVQVRRLQQVVIEDRKLCGQSGANEP